MNRIILLLNVTSFFLLVSVFSTAQAEDYKIGVVNAVRVLEQSPQAKETASLIENEFLPLEKEIVASQQALQELESKLEKDAAIMSESERQKIERDIINRRRDLKRSEDEFREDLTYRRNEELAKIQTEIIQAIQAVSQANNYDIVLSEGVIFASPKTDMTNLVIEYLTKQAAN